MGSHHDITRRYVSRFNVEANVTEMVKTLKLMRNSSSWLIYTGLEFKKADDLNPKLAKVVKTVLELCKRPPIHLYNFTAVRELNNNLNVDLT